MNRLKFMSVLFLCSLQGIALADFKWELGSNVSETYDDNITYAHTDRLSDEISKLSLNGGFILQNKNSQAELKTTLTENIYGHHSNLDNLQESLLLNAGYDLSPYDSFKLNESFDHSQEPTTIVDTFGRTSGRYDAYNNRVDLEYDRVINEQWKGSFKYSELDYETSGQHVSTNEHNPGLGLEYDLDSANQFMFNYDFQDWTHSSGKPTNINILSGGYRHYLTTQLYFDLKPGLSFIDAQSGNRTVKPRYEADLIDDVDQNTQFKIDYVSSYTPIIYSQDNFNNWQWTLSAAKQLTKRINGNVSAFFGKGRYAVSGKTNKLTGANLGVEYDFDEKNSIQLGYLIERNDSNAPNQAYTKNTVNLQYKRIF